MKKIQFTFFRLIQGIIGYIPFRLLYSFSNFCSFLVYYVFLYRRKTVYKNLHRSFPEKSEKELKKIARKFYRNLCDVFIESIKGYSISIEELLKRYKCLNPEVANSYFEKGQSIIFALSHYANWEWGSQVAGSVFMHNAISFYKPLSNKYIDRHILKQREARGMTLCSINQTKFIFRSEDRTPRAYFLIGDQSPSNAKKAYWVNFLNQETACIHGIESYARLFNLPVIYLDMQRVTRGYYTVELKLICNKPQETKTGEITGLYMKALEEIIVKKPEDWLWSHKRWKKKRSIDALSDFRANYSEIF